MLQNTHVIILQNNQIMRTSDLPFEIERACRCSFIVCFNNGEHAFISNANLLAFINNPYIQYEIVLRRDSRGIETKWIAVYKCTIDLGFKKPISYYGERR